MMFEVDLFSGEATRIVSHHEALADAKRQDNAVDRNLENVGIIGNPDAWPESVKKALTLDICQEIYEDFLDDMFALKEFVTTHGHLPQTEAFRQAWREEIAWMWGMNNSGIRFDALMQINGVRPQLARAALMDNFREDVQRALDELNLRVLH